MPLPILDPLSLGALIQGGVGLAKGITGGFQASRARKRLKELEKQEPKRYIASAILERAKEPIAEEFMEAQEMGAQRRTSQGIGALSQGGSRAILGGLPQIADQERMGEMQRAGQYEQARQDALGTLGAAQTNLIEANRRDWMNKVLAQTQQMGAGTQNIMTGLTDIGKAGLTYASGDKDDDSTLDKDVKIEEGADVLDEGKLDASMMETETINVGNTGKTDMFNNGDGTMTIPTIKGNITVPSFKIRKPSSSVGSSSPQMGDIIDNKDGTMTIYTPNGPVVVSSTYF